MSIENHIEQVFDTTVKKLPDFISVQHAKKCIRKYVARTYPGFAHLPIRERRRGLANEIRSIPKVLVFGPDK